MKTSAPAGAAGPTAGERFKQSFYRSLPIAAGAALGLALARPPAWLDALGDGRYALAAFLVLCVVLGLVVVLVAANLPAHLALVPERERPLGGELGNLVGALRKAGFRDVGPPFRLVVATPATLVGFVHESGRAYASIFVPGARGADATFDVVSVLGGGAGGLTSAASPLAGALPVRPGSLRQLFPGAGVAEVWRHHEEALPYLRQQGVQVDIARADAYADEYRRAYAAIRSAFFAHTLHNSLLTLWRAATQRTPELGSIVGRTDLGPTLRLLRGAAPGSGARTS